jgi:hypothetical protein
MCESRLGWWTTMPATPDLAIVEVGGAPRPINLALLEENRRT